MRWSCRRREGSKVDGTEDRTELNAKGSIADKDALTAMAGMFETRMLWPQYEERLLEPSVVFAHVLWNSSLLAQRKSNTHGGRLPLTSCSKKDQAASRSQNPSPSRRQRQKPRRGTHASSAATVCMMHADGLCSVMLPFAW